MTDDPYDGLNKEALIKQLKKRTGPGEPRSFGRLTKPQLIARLRDLDAKAQPTDALAAVVEAEDTLAMSDGDLLAYVGTDGGRWANAFMQRAHLVSADDLHDTLRGWFANAIEAGRSAGEDVHNLAKPFMGSVLTHFDEAEWKNGYTGQLLEATPVIDGDKLISTIKHGLEQVCAALDPTFKVELEAEQQLEIAQATAASLANEVVRLRALLPEDMRDLA